jgi:hypothetical protein
VANRPRKLAKRLKAWGSEIPFHAPFPGKG